MDLKVGETVLLENDREYAVISIVQKDDKEYAYLLTVDKPYIVKFAKIEIVNDSLNLDFVNDVETKQELLKLFQEKIAKPEI